VAVAITVLSSLFAKALAFITHLFVLSLCVTVADDVPHFLVGKNWPITPIA